MNSIVAESGSQVKKSGKGQETAVASPVRSSAKQAGQKPAEMPAMTLAQLNSLLFD